MKPYRIGLYEKAMPKNLTWPEKLAVAKECGYDYVEISIDETDEKLARLEWTAEERRELVRQMEEIGLPIRSMCLSGHRKYPLGATDPLVRARGMEIMEKAIVLADDLGIRTIQLAGYDVYYEEGDADTEKWFCENLAKATDMAAEAGVVLAFETMETPFMDTVGKAMKYVDLIGSPWLGVYPDIGNLKNAAVLYGHDTAEEMKLGKGHIFAVHLKETRPGVYRDMDFGQPDGHTEYASCIEESLKMGVRMFTGEFWHQKGNEDWMKTICSASAFLREKIESAAARLQL